jgi:hypothetical protein
VRRLGGIVAREGLHLALAALAALLGQEAKVAVALEAEGDDGRSSEGLTNTSASMKGASQAVGAHGRGSNVNGSKEPSKQIGTVRKPKRRPRAVKMSAAGGMWQQHRHGPCWKLTGASNCKQTGCRAGSMDEHWRMTQGKAAQPKLQHPAAVSRAGRPPKPRLEGVLCFASHWLCAVASCLMP